jgi:hypothetical protein
MGGTGVTPVKSGVAPDFDNANQSQLNSRPRDRRDRAKDFGHDAPDDRPEAGAGKVILNGTSVVSNHINIRFLINLPAATAPCRIVRGHFMPQDIPLLSC